MFKYRKITTKKRRKLFVYWFVALVLITAFFVNASRWFSSLVSYFNQPAGVELIFNNYSGEKIVGVILANPLVLATFDRKDRQVNLVELPSNLYLEVGDRGFYLASNVAKLSPDEAEGVKLLTGALTANFKIPIDFYLDFKNSTLEVPEILDWANKISQPSSVWWFFRIPTNSKSVLKTNFTLFEQLKLFRELRQVRKDKFKLSQMNSANFEEIVLPNGDTALKISDDGLLPDTANLFLDLQIAQSGNTLAVYNATGKPGLAQTVTEICQNLGYNAVIAGEADEQLATTKILAKSDLIDSFAVKRLEKTFGGNLKKQVNSGLAEIEIFVGEDLARKLLF